MRRRKLGFVKRMLSITLALALVVSGMQVTVSPAHEASAASKDSTMGNNEMLSEKHVKDPKVLRFYTILANVQELEESADLKGKTAEQILATYTDDKYTKQAYGSYLTEYDGEIDFGTMEINYIDGIGWARSATKIDLSKATFKSGFTKVPDNEFALCTKLETILLPDTITEIGNNAFESCQALTTLSIGTGEDGVVDLTNVDTVGASAFSVCSSITTVKFSPLGTRSTELKLGEKAFANCSKISEIEIPIETAANLGANAFENCAALESVGLQDNLGYINNAVFQGVGTTSFGVKFYIIGSSDISQSRLPKGITFIGDNAFSGAWLTSLDLSGCTKLTTINQYAFGTAYVPGLTLPESLETIESMAFNATSISKLTIPEKCTNIQSKAFYNSGLEEIELPASLTEIKEATFALCDDLIGSKIVIPSGSKLQTIGKDAFKECKKIGTTEFLNNCKKLTSIGDSAFAKCYQVKMDPLNPKSELTDLYGDKVFESGLETVVLPDSVATIGTEAFADNYALKTVKLGTGLINIPDKAFYNSKTTSSKSGASLEKVIVSSELESVGDSAFANQSRLTTIGYTDGSTTTVKEGTVQFKSGLLSIGDSAFAGCGIQSTFSANGLRVYIPASEVKTSYTAGCSEFLIYDYENSDKEDNYCRSVYIDESEIVKFSDIPDDYKNKDKTELNEEGQSVYRLVNVIAKKVYIDESAFTRVISTSNADKTLEAYDSYETVTDAYQNRLYSPNKTLVKLYFTGSDASAAVSSTPDSAKTPIWARPISGTSSFSDLPVANSSSKSFSANYAFGIQNVIIPDTLIDDNLGQKAFENCINLEQVKLSLNLTDIKDGTFSGAGKEVPNFLGTSDELKYYDYYGLRTINIPDGIKTIGNDAFKNCYNLVLQKKGGSSFGRNIVSIGNNAFNNCLSLSEVKFPDTLKSIGSTAFANCTIQYKEPAKISYADNKGEYSYYVNAPSYGTKEIKHGLKVIDFTGALSLETVGDGAFRMTNVEDVSLIDSPLVKIPNNLFNQCSYLKTIAFQDKTESIGADVLKDTINLSGVTLPASATLTKTTISGAFGGIVNNTDPTLTLSYDKNEIITVPYGSSLRLPINALNKDIINGDVKISVDTGDGVFKNILDTTVGGISAEFNTSDDPYSFILYGKDFVKDPVTVRVEMGTAFSYAKSANYWISSHTMEYQVKVEAVPTQKVTVSAAEDSSVKTNPDMYVEKDGNKVLYIPAKGTAATKGIKLSAVIDPTDTTEDVTWTSDNTDAMVISDVVYEKGNGISTAVVKAAVDENGKPKIGNAKITVSSGTKSDTIFVYSVIPVTSSSGIVCTTGGTNLDTNLKPNSKTNPYGLDIGSTDQIKVTLNYGDAGYTEEEKAQYGEKCVFVSSDPEVVSVSQDGTIKALKEGTAVITVKGQASGMKADFYFEVASGLKASPASIEVSGPDKVNVGESISLMAAVYPAKASQSVTWSVATGKDIVSIDENGAVTGLKKGTAKVVATSAEKNTVKSNQFEITVLSPAKELKILTGDITLEVGKSQTLSKVSSATGTKGYYLSPADTTDTIDWSSSDNSVVTVTSTAQSVTIKAVAAGSAMLRGVTSSGIKAEIKVTVSQKAVKVTKITVGSPVTLNVGGVHQLTPQQEPANANEAITYTYTSSNPKVATVDGNGLIRAVAPGNANIVVKTNTGKTATCAVTVKQPAKKITLLVNKPSAKKIYMAKGQSINVKAKLDPVNTTDKLTWKSNKTKVATVSSSGTITAKKKGTAKITVTSDSGKKATITVVVSKKQVKAKKVKIKGAKSMKRKKTIKLTVSLKSAKSTDTITFSSNKPAVATVDAYGYVTAKKKGKVKITVSSSSGKKATKTIKVK